MAIKALDGLKAAAVNAADAAKEAAAKIDIEKIKDSAESAGAVIAKKAGEAKELAVNTKEEIEAKLTELDRMLSQSITEYNNAFTLMNDKGMQLFVERAKAVDLLNYTEALINSIANHPKSFDADFEEIRTNRQAFIDNCEFADRELAAARVAAGGAGAGIAAGASVAFMAPTAAMWVATTFGTASTGTAIASLSGAAASNAALAWLGGGAVAAGGGGIAGGNALLALAGPIGWSIAGATLLTSIILFTAKKTKLNKEKNEEIEAVKKNIEAVKEMDAKIGMIFDETAAIKEGLSKLYLENLKVYGKNYSFFSGEQKQELGVLVNMAKSLSVLFGKTVEQ